MVTQIAVLLFALLINSSIGLMENRILDARIIRNRRVTERLHSFELKKSSTLLNSQGCQQLAVVGIATTSLPSTAVAAVSTSAKEALMLLDGYQSLAPVPVTWTVLIVGGVWLYFKIYKILASL